MKTHVIFILVVLASGLADGQRRRRVRSTTASTMATTPAFGNRQLGFAGQPEDLETLWDSFDIQKLDSRSESWRGRNNSLKNDEITRSTGRQLYPGLAPNPGDTNELPNPISPPGQSTPPPQHPAPGCLGLRGQYPSPKGCANYLNCWDNVVIEQTCPDGLLFNDVTERCDYDYNVNCGSRPLPTPKPPLPPGTKKCPDPNGRYRSSTNCSEFYVCVLGRPIKFCCPHGLVYNDILDVCDYPYNVDCKGSATPTPHPPHPTHPTHHPHPPTHHPYPPPTYAPQPPTYAPQPPTYAPQPTYQPQPTSYPGNPWLNKFDPDPWHQRPVSSQLEIDQERFQQEISNNDEQSLSNMPQDVVETSSLMNPWNLFQIVPAELMKNPCNNGDMHRLNEACTNMVVCRNNRPQLVRCSIGFSYDKPTDSCKPFSIAKC